MFDPLEDRVPCPVCLAGKMIRAPVGPRRKRLVLDHCSRCGGVWFDAGEVAGLRAAGPEALAPGMEPRDRPWRMRCRVCDALVHRDQDACSVCDQPNTLDCPRCDRPMRVARVQGIRLDACEHCRGVWLDSHEIRRIWEVELEGARRRLVGSGQGAGPAGWVPTGGASPGRAATGDLGVGGVPGEARPGTKAAGVAVEPFLWAPDLAILGLDAAGHALAAGASVAGPGLGAALEAVGAAAQAAFELVVEAIASIV